MITLKLEPIIDLDDKTLARCRELSFGDDGYMEEDLDRILLTEPIKGRPAYRLSTACLAYWEDKLVGWSLLQPRPRSPRWLAYFFVDPEYRGRGIGTKLLHQANAYSEWKYRPVVCLQNHNKGFFEKHPSLYAEV